MYDVPFEPVVENNDCIEPALSKWHIIRIGQQLVLEYSLKFYTLVFLFKSKSINDEYIQNAAQNLVVWIVHAGDQYSRRHRKSLFDPENW